MRHNIRSRAARALVGVAAAAVIALPVTAMATQAGDDTVSERDKKLPKNLRKFKSPLSKKKNDSLVKKGAAKYGPGKKKLPRFKKDVNKKTRSAAIGAVDRTMHAIKADPAATAELKDAVSVWESLTGPQKNSVLANSDAVVAAWPAAAAATAAVVTAVVAVADFTYDVYVDQRDNTGGEDDDEETDDEDDEDGEDDDEDTGDAGDTGTIRGALGY